MKAAAAVLRGASYAEAARAAGSTATDPHALKVIGFKLVNAPSTAKVFRSHFEKREDALWAKVIGWIDDVFDNREKHTNLDRYNCARVLAAAQGRNVIKVEQTTRHVLEFRGFRELDEDGDVTRAPRAALPEPEPRDAIDAVLERVAAPVETA